MFHTMVWRSSSLYNARISSSGLPSRAKTTLSHLVPIVPLRDCGYLRRAPLGAPPLCGKFRGHSMWFLAKGSRFGVASFSWEHQPKTFTPISVPQRASAFVPVALMRTKLNSTTRDRLTTT
mmetsp:Transcript_36420/g.95681  ORF Transcript_36420/g.95681 Transcript_36420/m.95681 type:complete len:121 (+) Transcript_36420:416-778(+)